MYFEHSLQRFSQGLPLSPLFPVTLYQHLWGIRLNALIIKGACLNELLKQTACPHHTV